MLYKIKAKYSLRDITYIYIYAVVASIYSKTFIDDFLYSLWYIKNPNSGCLQDNGPCAFILCLQMRMDGEQNKGMALKHHSSGPLRGRISPSSQIATFLGTSLLLVSKARKRSGLLCAPVYSSSHVLALPCVCFPAKFLGKQVLSYGQNLSFSFRVDRRDTRLSAEDLVLEGAGLRVAVPLIAQGNSYPSETTVKYVFR